MSVRAKIFFASLAMMGVVIAAWMLYLAGALAQPGLYAGSRSSLLAVGGLITLVVAFLASAALAHLFARAFQRVSASVHAVASTAVPERQQALGVDGFGGLKDSVAAVAEKLAKTVATLQEERNRVEAILEGMSDAVLALDGEQRITLVNAAALELLHLERAPVGGRLLEVIRAPELLALVSAARTGDVGEVELELLGPAPQRILARATPLVSYEGVVLVLRDVTELRRLERVRRDFVANVSHELRTPVSVVRANAETLLDSALDDPEGARRFVEAILRNAERLSALLADLLDISRIEAGQYALIMAPVALAPSIDAVLAELSPRAKSKGIVLRRGAVAEGLAVMADKGAFTQVLANLVDNAIKYTPAGGHVEVGVFELGEELAIDVDDDGPGIELRHRTRIFERFYRVDAGRSREMGGTGLGLSIVKNLTEAMGGKVSVAPRAPRGSSFRVQLTRAV